MKLKPFGNLGSQILDHHALIPKMAVPDLSAALGVLQPVWVEHERIAAKLVDMNRFIQPMLKASEQFRSILDSQSFKLPTGIDPSIFDQSWRKSFDLAGISQVNKDIARFVEATASATLINERFCERFHFEQLPYRALTKYETDFTKVLNSFGTLSESIKNAPDFVAIPNFALPGASHQVFVTSRILDRFVSPDETEDDEEFQELETELRDDASQCMDTLKIIDPAFCKLLTGAIEALNGTSIDRVRHFLISLRELWTHLIHRLAPDDVVLEWVASQQPNDLLHDGRPTRRARILYIGRKINHGPLSGFITHDTNALLKLSDIFQKVHELDHDFSSSQLDALMLKFQSEIVYLVRLSQVEDDGVT